MVWVTSECAWRVVRQPRRGEGSAEDKSATCFLVPTAQDKIDHFLSVEYIFPIHDTQGSESPVNRVQAQMSGHMVGKIIFVLCSLQSEL